MSRLARSRTTVASVALILTTAASSAVSAATATLPALPQPDDRYKADILLIVGHPDDDTGATPYLAKAVFDEHRRIAVVYGTRGNSGDNHLGMEQAKTLGDIREIEGRKALASLGISNVWFLHNPDTPGQDVLHSLEAWGHGAALENVVRIVRLTRPEVILTMLPAYVSGENHGDHQAAAVLAVEAFDQAANPLAFAEQVNAPRKRDSINNYGEGLKLWQPKKLYFMDGGYHDFSGKGPMYSATQISPSKGVAYGQFRKQAWDFYATQYSLPEEWVQKLAVWPTQFIFGKSLVSSEVTAGIFTGIDTGSSVVYSKPKGYVPDAGSRLPLELGGPWAFYRRFWQAHDLEQLASLIPPEGSVGVGDPLWVPLLINNDASTSRQFTLRAALPPGWIQQEAQELTVTVAAHDSYPVQLNLTAPKGPSGGWQTLKWTVESKGSPSTDVQLRMYLDKRSILPQ